MQVLGSIQKIAAADLVIVDGVVVKARNSPPSARSQKK